MRTKSLIFVLDETNDINFKNLGNLNYFMMLVKSYTNITPGLYSLRPTSNPPTCKLCLVIL